MNSQLESTPLQDKAEGYRRGLEALVGHLDVLDASGVPRAVDLRPTTVFEIFVPVSDTVASSVKPGPNSTGLLIGRGSY